MNRFAGRVIALFALIACFVTPLILLALEHPVGAILMAIVPVATDRSIKQIKADLAKLYGELEAGQKEMESGPLAQNRGEDLDKKATEAEGLQAAIFQYERLRGLAEKGREIPDPALPESKDQKRDRKGRVQTTRGHLFVLSDQYKNWLKDRQGMSGSVEVKEDGRGRVVLRGKAAEAFESKAFSAGDLSDLGDDALIQPTFDSEVVRYEEPEQQTVRDLLRVLPVTTDSVRFVRHTATERAAQSQESRGALKKFLNVTFAPDTVNVETIAVLSKVTEQDIEDAPRLVGIINGEQRLDIKVEEDRQILWGSGASGQLDGIFTQGIPEFDRAEGGDTLIDTIRRMRTDIRLQRMMPNGVLIHPLDWEEVELEKGSDSRYVWAVISTPLGPRIWGMAVVESESAENPDTGERRVVVADWLRGATLYDRHDVRLAVGFMDDDFGRNLRTLRAEERLALALKRDFAFTYSVTGEAS